VDMNGIAEKIVLSHALNVKDMIGMIKLKIIKKPIKGNKKKRDATW